MGGEPRGCLEPFPSPALYSLTHYLQPYLLSLAFLSLSSIEKTLLKVPRALPLADLSVL